MRKEDRVRQQAQNPPERAPDQPQRRPNEQITGKSSAEQTNQKPQKHDVLPIPD